MEFAACNCYTMQSYGGFEKRGVKNVKGKKKKLKTRHVSIGPKWCGANIFRFGLFEL